MMLWAVSAQIMLCLFAVLDDELGSAWFDFS